MATTAGTDEDDVKAEIDTNLTQTEIEGDGTTKGILDLVENDIDREYGSSPGFDDTQHRIDFEAALAALRIAEGNARDAQDRTAEEVQSGRSAVTYEASTVKSLRQRVRRRDPGNAFGHGSAVIRDSNRKVTSTDF